MILVDPNTYFSLFINNQQPLLLIIWYTISKDEYDTPSNKQNVNAEVTLTGQNPPLKCGGPVEIWHNSKKIDLSMLKIWYLSKGCKVTGH